VPYTKPNQNVLFIIVLSYNLIFFRGFNTRYGRYSVNEIIRKNASSYINKYHTCLILQTEKVAQNYLFWLLVFCSLRFFAILGGLEPKKTTNISEKLKKLNFCCILHLIKKVLFSLWITNCSTALFLCFF
jgi:hypothetical protein